MLRLALAASSIGFADANCSGAGALESANNLSLARAYPIERLGEILLPREQWHPFPTLKERERWRALPKQVLIRSPASRPAPKILFSG
jgi:hypothetical protein